MIHTVRGPIEAHEMGMTLGHEHFKWEFDDTVTHELYYNHNYDMTDLEADFKVLLPLMLQMKQSGVGTIVEASPPMGGQNVKLLHRLSEASGVQIVPCTGWNAFRHMHKLIGEAYADLLSRRWIEDFESGLDTVDGVCIRPGYIKILLEKGGVSAHDRAMLTGAVKASRATGMPIHCHILEGQYLDAVLDHVFHLGLSPNKFLWAHADRESEVAVIANVIRRGIWVGIDMIKKENHLARRELVKSLLESGVENRMILSQDYDFYEEMKAQPEGHPCTSLVEAFLPLCLEGAIDAGSLKKMMCENPAAFYSF